MGKGKKGAKAGAKAKGPKKKCCVSKSRCKRCPIRMLREGTLPPGYAVKKRRLVKLDEKASKKSAKKAEKKAA